MSIIHDSSNWPSNGTDVEIRENTKFVSSKENKLNEERTATNVVVFIGAQPMSKQELLILI